MSSSVEDNSQRMFGNSQTLDFMHRPVCPYCLQEMHIRDTSKSKTVVDLNFNYHLRTRFYRCYTLDCPGLKASYSKPFNNHTPPKSPFSYNVIGKVVQLRWHDHKTYLEIINTMKQDYKIALCLNTVENMLKIYEIGCSDHYRPEYIAQIKENKGIIITIDGMAPMKGNRSLYVVYDYESGLTLGAERLPNQKAETIVSFLHRIKQRIAEEINVPIKEIISDALPSQRIAIADVFPEIPHCLCHYHFYELVLTAPKEADSKIMTQVRSSLRNMYDLKKFKEIVRERKDQYTSCEFLIEVLKILEALAQWARKPKDPCFSGLLLYSRVKDIAERMDKAEEIIKNQGFPCHEEKIFSRINRDLHQILDENKELADQLEHINEKLKDLKQILGDLDLSYTQSLVELRKLRDRLRERTRAKNCGPIELEFINAVKKYIRTKIELLFNYKSIEGAPTTNNSHELQFRQLKHFLRRVIGFAAAKKYLLVHGERIVYVNPKEKIEGILQILMSKDYSQARRVIKQERSPQDSLRLVAHKSIHWSAELSRLDAILQNYNFPLLIIN